MEEHIKYLRRPDGTPYGCFMSRLRVNESNFPEIFCGWSLCSPKDQFNKKFAKERAGSRITDQMLLEDLKKFNRVSAEYKLDCKVPTSIKHEYEEFKKGQAVHYALRFIKEWQSTKSYKDVSLKNIDLSWARSMEWVLKNLR